MINNNYNMDDIIAALATPWGQGALAVIRTAGAGCIEAVDTVFRSKKRLADVPGNTLVYGALIDPERDGIKIDEVMAGLYRSPASYTGQDMVEIFCHGSLPGIAAILELLRKNGFRDANPGEFTLRAFLNGKIDLTQAEAVNEIIKSKTEKAQSLALSRLSGGIEERINTAKDIIAQVLAAVELQLDYPEDEGDPEALTGMEELDEASVILEQLVSTYKIGKIIQEGVNAAFTGKTNAGKSALFNLLSREDRSIVSDFHGTTRDYIESYISIRGIPVKIYDTAGLRSSGQEAGSPVEEEGIKRTSRIISNADILIYIIDSTAGISAEDSARLLELESHRVVKVWNKIDIGSEAAPGGFIPVSAVTGEGLHRLEEEILKQIGGGSINSGDSAVIDSERQKKLIESCLASLYRVMEADDVSLPLDIAAVELRDALDSLGEITGEVTTMDILDMIFSRFCVGK